VDRLAADREAMLPLGQRPYPVTSRSTQEIALPERSSDPPSSAHRRRRSGHHDRDAAVEQEVSGSDIMRAALRQYLDIED
jgi:hypothetical protein